MKRYAEAVVVLSTAALISINCGKSKSNDPAPAAATTSTATSAEQANALALAYPTGLSISAFPQTTSTTLALAGTPTDPAKMTAKQKKEAAENRLKGGADTSCFSKEMFGTRQGATVTCYEFDSDMGPDTRQDGNTYGTTDGTDGRGEACMVSKARSLMESAVGAVDKALATIEAMMCQAKKTGGVTGPPANVGDTLDLVAHLKKASEGSGKMTPSVASMKRLADVDGRKVYRSTVSFSESDGKSFTLNLVHSPAADGTNNTYNGILWTKKANADGKNRVSSVQYAKDSTGSTNIRLLRARVKESLDPFNTDGTLNLNVNATFDGNTNSNSYGNYATANANDTIEGMTLIDMNMNTTTNVGTLAYWKNPGGNYYENARGFLFSVDKDTTNNRLHGCGVAGAAHYSPSPGQGISIRRSMKEATSATTLEPRGYYHPFAANNSHANKDTRQPNQTGTTISKQCFYQNAADGKWMIDTGKTTASQGYDVVEANAGGISRPPIDGKVKKFSSNVKQ